MRDGSTFQYAGAPSKSTTIGDSENLEQMENVDAGDSVYAGAGELSDTLMIATRARLTDPVLTATSIGNLRTAEGIPDPLHSRW